MRVQRFVHADGTSATASCGEQVEPSSRPLCGHAAVVADQLTRSLERVTRSASSRAIDDVAVNEFIHSERPGQTEV